jgi:hypothetical protein
MLLQHRDHTACHVTLDLQVVEAVQSTVRTATIFGLRASLSF